MLMRPRLPTPRRLVCPSRVALLACVALALCSACTSGHQTALDEARALQASGRVEEAIDRLREILAEDAESPEANFMLAKVLVQAGRPRQAIEPLRTAAAHERYQKPAGLLLASTLFRTRAYEEAIRAADDVIAVDPSNVIALLTRGQSQMASRQPERALRDAERILEIEPEHSNATMLKGGALVDLGRGDEAERIWIDLRKRLTERGPPDQAARACAQLALFYRTQREQDRADETYRECLEAFPTHIALQQSASEFYLRHGQVERATEIHRKAAEAAPDDLRLWARLADLLLRAGETEDAQRTLEETADRFDSPEAWRLLADFHHKTGDAIEARSALEAAIALNQEPNEAYLFALADLLVEQGDLEQAREIGATLTEQSYRSLLEGAIALRSGDPRTALERFEAGLALWPNNPSARYRAGQAALQLNDQTRAIAELEEAMRIAPFATDAAGDLADLYLARGDLRLAAHFAQRQIARRPFRGPDPYRIAIRAAIRMGELERARALAEALEQADPDGLAWLIEVAEIERSETGPQRASELILASGRDLADPANEPLLRALAGDLDQLGRGAEALTKIDVALASDPRRATLHELRARILSSLDRFEEAEASTRRALDLDPGLAPALEMKALLALRRGDHGGALAALDAAAAARPREPGFPHAAAGIARERGDEERAIAYLEEALARQPEYGPAANDLAWLLASRRERLDQALELARLAVNRARPPAKPHVLDTLGWVHFQRGEFERAIGIFQSALDARAEATPDLPAVRYRLALALAAGGETAEARALLGDLVEGPAFPELEQARAELLRIGGS